MNDKKKKIIAFTTIHHRVRKELDISLEDYCVADAIYHLSNNPKSKIYGWCYSSKKYISDFIKINERTVYRSIENLISKKILEKDEETKYLKTTSIWYEKVVLERLKSDTDKLSDTLTKCQSDTDKLSVDTLTKCQSDTDKLSYNIDNISKEDKERNKKEIFPDPPPEWLDKETWASWVTYRKERRSPLTKSTVTSQLKELEKNKSDHKEIIEQSIRNGWIGLFPLKNARNKPDSLKIGNKYDKYE